MTMGHSEQPGQRALGKIYQRLRFALRRASSPERLAQSIVEGLGVADVGHQNAGKLAQALCSDPSTLAYEIGAMAADEAVAGRLTRRLLGAKLFTQRHPLVVSLGAHCYTSAMLMRWGLRPWAGPFDWLFSSPAMVTHCLQDNFALLLDRDQYRPVPVDERPAGREVNRVNHAGFLQRFGVEFVFNHHDVHLDEGYAYLQRCVARYRQCLASAEPVIHLLSCWYYEGVEDDLRRLSSALSSSSSAARLLAFVIRDASGQASAKIDLMQRDPTGATYLLQPASRWQALEFPDFIDEHALVHVLANECRQHQSAAGQMTGPTLQVHEPAQTASVPVSQPAHISSEEQHQP